MKFLKGLEHAVKMRRRYKILRGVKLDVSSPEIDGYVKETVVRGLYEAEEFAILSHLLKPEDRVLELGACIGFLSTFAAQRCGSKNVMCIEANKRLISVIETNHSLNDVSPKIINAIASSEDREKQPFYVGQRITSSSTIERADKIRTEQNTVNVSRLISEFQPTVLLVDIEGGEVNLLPELDLGDVQLIIVEFHPPQHSPERITDSIRAVIDKGYSLRIEKTINSCVVLQKNSEVAVADTSEVAMH